MTLELELSCLNFVEHGSVGLMVAVDHLSWLLAEVKGRGGRNAVIQKAADTFMEVQRAIMKELIRSYDASADHSVLIKFFNMFISTLDNSKSMRNFLRKCERTKREKYSMEEHIQIIGLWKQVSNKLFLWSFWYFLKFLLNVCLDYFTWRGFLLYFLSRYPDRWWITVRWHLPNLRKYALQRAHRADIPLQCYHVCNFLRVLIKSTTYLVNCWCLLDQADLTVASEIMKEQVTNLLDIIFCLIGTRIWSLESFYHPGLGRLLRCISSVIVKRENSAVITKPLARFLKTFFDCTIKKPRSVSLSYFSIFFDFFPLLSRVELGAFQEKFQNEMRILSEAGHSLQKYERAEEALESTIEMEEGLSSLSREDANIVFLPDHVNNAIDSLPSEATTFIPEVGVFTLLHRNKNRMQSLEWAQEVLILFDRAVEVEPIILDSLCYFQ